MKLRDLPKVVDPVAMIGMVMGNDDAIDVGRSGGQQLFAKVRTTVDQ